MEAFGALATKPELLDPPEASCRPFDGARAGTVIGEGGSAMVLQSEKFWLEH